MKLLLLALGLISLSFILTSCQGEEEEVKEEKKEEEGVIPRQIKTLGPGRGFNRELVKLDGIADQLFLEFLDAVESAELATNTNFKILDIPKYIPFKRTKISDEDTYNNYILVMLSSQMSRDYFIYLNEPDLRDTFTHISDDPRRDNEIWKKKYGEVEFRINPKYVIM